MKKSNMQPVDLHTHTTHSDGQVQVAELVAKAKEKGYGLGISDHLFCEHLYTPEKISAYLDDLGRYPVWKGAEANIGEDYSLPERVMERFDYIISSVHSIPDPFSGRFTHLGNYFGKRAGDEGITEWKNPFLMSESERYLEAVLPMSARTMSTQRMDIYGHCLVLPFYEYLSGSAFLIDWENELIALCKKYEVALEISGLWQEPNVDLIIRAKKEGIKFTFGSDCHIRKDLCNLEYPLKAAALAGLTPEDLWFPQKERVL